MIRSLFLILFLLSAAGFAQTIEPPQAVLIEEFERATNGYVKMKMDYFYSDLGNNPAARGVIINYGTAREIAIRERQVRASLAWRNYDASRITIVNGGFRQAVRSEFWRVPPGAVDPQPNSKAQKIDEFGRIYEEDLTARLQNLYIDLVKSPDSRAYILIYGSAKAVALNERRIRKLIDLLKLDPKPLTIRNAGLEQTNRTEFWIVPAEEKKRPQTKIYIVPAGAKPPTKRD